MKTQMMRIVVTLALVAGAAWAIAGTPAPGAAQEANVAWYRIVNQGRSAGTMARWRRVGPQGATHTFPFMEGFEVAVRPSGDTVSAVVHDGRSLVSSTVSCSRPGGPQRAMLLATRDGADQPTIMVLLECSATEPVVR